MTLLRTNLSTVLEKFPEHQETIKRLFRVNESFQTLCEDYRQCSKALRYWSHSASEEAPARREEYGDLLQDLSEEILQTLDGK